MVMRGAAPHRLPRGFLPTACAVGALLLVWAGAGSGRQAKVDVLRIGTSGGLAPEKKESSALETLKGFIKEETGLDNEILRQKDWRELVEKLGKGELHLGVLQGFEYAWAQEKHPELKP